MGKTPCIWIESLTFSDGSVLKLKRGEVVVFVGANNSGKSAALRGLRNKLNDTKMYSPVLTSIRVKLEGDLNDLIEWIEQIAFPNPDRPDDYAYLGATAPMKIAHIYWKPTGSQNSPDFDGLDGFAGFFCRYLDTEGRLCKSTGRAFIPSGDPSQALSRLLGYLEAKGLFVVECGELECFVRSVPHHGPAWVNKALERDLMADPELEDARRFVRKLVSPNKKRDSE